jgi:HD-GYP domain-containing protein (c-di-GMP phosphodiesterase class II)
VRIISLIGWIVAVADSYDAMTSEQPYRKAKTNEYAINELKINVGKQFDPKLLEIFIEALKNNK